MRAGYYQNYRQQKTDRELAAQAEQNAATLSANSLLCNQKFRELQQRREVQRLEQEIECLKTKLSIPAALGSEFVA